MISDTTYGSQIPKVAASVWRALSASLHHNTETVSVSTFPDYDDTLRALQRAAAERSVVLEVLIADIALQPPDWLDPVVSRVHYKRSLTGVAAFHRSSATLFTHGLYSAFPLVRDRPTLNLWHGTPIKRIGRLDPRSTSRLPRSHWIIAESEAFRPIMAEAFSMDPSQVLIMEHPRLDVMASPPHFRRWWPETERALLVWLPTYRKSARGEIREDGGDLPFASEVEMRRLDALLDREGGTLIVKLHPSEAVQSDSLPRFRHIEFVDDFALRERGVSLYQLLGLAEALVTDISSVLFDFRHTGRPMWVYFPDLKVYEASRGFVAPLSRLINEPIIDRFEVLLEHLGAFLLQRKISLEPQRLLRADRARTALDHVLLARERAS